MRLSIKFYLVICKMIHIIYVWNCSNKSVWFCMKYTSRPELLIPLCSGPLRYSLCFNGWSCYHIIAQTLLTFFWERYFTLCVLLLAHYSLSPYLPTSLLPSSFPSLPLSLSSSLYVSLFLTSLFHVSIDTQNNM